MNNLNKSNKNIYIFILAIFISFIVCDFIIIFPFLYSENVNKHGITVDSTWANSANSLQSDAILNTLLTGKICICNPDSYYRDYISVFANETIFDESIPNGDEVDGMTYQSYCWVGSSQAYNHETLVDSDSFSKIDSKLAIIRLYTEGYEESDRVIFFNDSVGNIYLISEDNWNEQK